MHNREENIPSLRALDSYIKEKLSIVLSPASLELHQITWDDPASFLEKIVAYEVCLSSDQLFDLKLLYRLYNVLISSCFTGCAPNQ